LDQRQNVDRYRRERKIMSDILNKTIVLVLNRNWQAINIRTPQDAFCQMATNVATALDIELGDNARAEALRPVTWDEWLTLPVRAGDHTVRTARGAIRVPTVIVAVNFAKVPKKRPKLSAKNIRARDGNRCQYTGRLLHPDEGSLDHVVPRSRGGADTWENLVWSPRALARSRLLLLAQISHRFPCFSLLLTANISQGAEEKNFSRRLNPGATCGIKASRMMQRAIGSGCRFKSCRAHHSSSFEP
jgi:5-methylcytosine-specific restriction endonuclease McrA